MLIFKMYPHVVSIINLLVAPAFAAWPRQGPFNHELNAWPDSSQVRLSGDAKSFESQFSVGLALHSSYGAATVIFDGPDGTRKVTSRVVQADKEYRDIMGLLSLEKSRHLA
jgi:hypothetical protein